MDGPLSVNAHVLLILMGCALKVSYTMTEKRFHDQLLPERMSRKGAPVGLPCVLLYQGVGGQPCCLITQEVAVHSRPPLPAPFCTPSNLQRTPKANPKHCNLQGFCDFCMAQILLAT